MVNNPSVINYLKQATDNEGHEFYFDHSTLEEAKPLYCGYQRCKPDHSFGPAMRDHIYYHFIASGCGIIKNEVATFQVKAGQGFIVFPNENAYYKADTSDPWDYIWIAFDGAKVDELLITNSISSKMPIIRHATPRKIEELMNHIVYCAHGKSKNSFLSATGLLFILLSEIFKDNYISFHPISETDITETGHYLNEAIYYIKKNYAENISVSSIAEHIGLDISYFGRIFKKQYRITPSEFLERYRLRMAYYLLHSTDLSIKKISSLVGFNDQLHFTKRFKHYSNTTPTEMRKEALASRD